MNITTSGRDRQSQGRQPSRGEWERRGRGRGRNGEAATSEPKRKEIKRGRVGKTSGSGMDRIRRASSTTQSQQEQTVRSHHPYDIMSMTGMLLGAGCNLPAVPRPEACVLIGRVGMAE